MCCGNEIHSHYSPRSCRVVRSQSINSSCWRANTLKKVCARRRSRHTWIGGRGEASELPQLATFRCRVHSDAGPQSTIPKIGEKERQEEGREHRDLQKAVTQDFVAIVRPVLRTSSRTPETAGLTIAAPPRALTRTESGAEARTRGIFRVCAGRDESITAHREQNN